MSMGYVQGSGWVIDFSMADKVHPDEYLWPHQFVQGNNVSGVKSVDASCKEARCKENTSSKKRAYDESSSGPRSKACREKLRRDRLNDKFLELCSVLDPMNHSNNDKGVILTDAAQVLNQLRAEAQKLKEANEALQDRIKNLKAEKMELRDEKLRLKAEKERIEHAIKSTTSTPSQFIPHLATAFHPSAAYASSIPPKATVVYPNLPPVTMWQWIPPASLDTSKDHVLRPPVA